MACLEQGAPSEATPRGDEEKVSSFVEALAAASSEASTPRGEEDVFVASFVKEQAVAPSEASTPRGGDEVEEVEEVFMASYYALAAAYPEVKPHILARFARCDVDPAKAMEIYNREREWRRTSGSIAEIEAMSSRCPDQQFCTGRREALQTVILVEGARYDASVKNAAEAHVALIVKRVEQILDSDDPGDAERRVVVLIDVRPNDGWFNPPGYKLIPLVRRVATTFPWNYPGRLEALVVYPVPGILDWVFRACTKIFNAQLQEKLHMISGPNRPSSPCPDALFKFVSLDEIPAHCHDRYKAA